MTPEQMYAFAEELFPICRSLTGDGVRQTLRLIARELPGLKIREVASGTRCFDWTVPPEWNIRDAYIADETGQRLVDFRKNNLHVVSYSVPVDTTLSLEEIQPHLHSLPDQPEAIPYVTSYYRRDWGFGLTHKQRTALKPGRYRVLIDSTLKPGHLTYAELQLPGTSRREVFISTYICHPSMANNEVSGPVLVTALAQWLMGLKERRYSYRIVFAPETIGALVYLSRNLKELRQRVEAGFIVTCVGDDRAVSFVPSRLGNTLADKVALHVLKHRAPGFIRYSYLDRASDERQYCSPGADLPVASIMRSKYHAYPEYHTSLDDMSLISPAGFADAYDLYQSCIKALEANRTYVAAYPGEPQLGRRGLYHETGTKEATMRPQVFLDFLAYCDGDHDLIDIAERIGQDATALSSVAMRLRAERLIREILPRQPRRRSRRGSVAQP